MLAPIKWKLMVLSNNQTATQLMVGMIRGDRGYYLSGFYGIIDAGNVRLAESWALLHGVRVAHNLNIKQVNL